MCVVCVCGVCLFLSFFVCVYIGVIVGGVGGSSDDAFPYKLYRILSSSVRIAFQLPYSGCPRGRPALQFEGNPCPRSRPVIYTS